MARRLRIAQVSPLAESVPPRGYGGTERVVSYLTEELVAQGHEVTLFATADSHTRARLMASAPEGLRSRGDCREPMAWHVAMLEDVVAEARHFDLIHSHVDFLGLPLGRRVACPVVTTMHGRMDLGDLEPVLRQFPEAALVSISMAQRRPAPDARWVGNVYHGLPPAQYPHRGKRGEYLAFVGRASPEKRLDTAISLAIRAGMPLRIAAKVDANDQDYFDAVIRPWLHHPLVEFLGEVGEADKSRLLAGAAALVFMVDWPEPFGLVMAEALACGTPVIARPVGSVPEIVEHGVTGFVCRDEEEALTAVRELGRIRRARCREVFESRFSAGRMARDYLHLFEAMIEGPKASLPLANGVPAPDSQADLFGQAPPSP